MASYTQQQWNVVEQQQWQQWQQWQQQFQQWQQQYGDKVQFDIYNKCCRIVNEVLLRIWAGSGNNN
jgi:hypothetical protein